MLISEYSANNASPNSQHHPSDFHRNQRDSIRNFKQHRNDAVPIITQYHGTATSSYKAISSAINISFTSTICRSLRSKSPCQYIRFLRVALLAAHYPLLLETKTDGQMYGKAKQTNFIILRAITTSSKEEYFSRRPIYSESTIYSLFDNFSCPYSSLTSSRYSSISSRNWRRMLWESF